MSQSPAAATPTGGGDNARTTLSDLLADDVRDYFLREGGGTARECADHDNVDASRTRRRRRRDGKSDYGGSIRHSRNGNSNKMHQLSSATSQTRFSSSSHSDDDDDDDDAGGDGNESRRWIKKGLQSYKSYQQKHYGDGRVREEQLRGQDTAERRSTNAIHHNIDYGAPRNPPPNMLRQKHQQQNPHQQRHRPRVSSFGSGSGSFHSNHRQHDSFGSGSGSGTVSPSSSIGRSSKNKYVSAADAEFLRRYAEEKERANSRLSYLSPNSVQSNASTTSPLSVHHKDQSPPPSRRPPTVMGSHRPALPSIDNDDWEEDDSIEKGFSECEKTKKKNQKKKEEDAKMAAAAVIRGNGDRRRRGTVEQQQQPAGVYTPDICSGSDADARHESKSRAMSPSQVSKKKNNSNHEREDSIGTFVRLRGLSPARSMGDVSSYGGSDSANNSVVSNIRHNSRPLSYLSASSGSGSSGEDVSMPSPEALRLQNQFRGETSTVFAAAAPAIMDGIRNSSGGSGHYQNRVVKKSNTSDGYSSTDGSDFLGYGIMNLNSLPSGSSESSQSPKHFVRINTRNQPVSRLQVTAMTNVSGGEGVDCLPRRTEKGSHQRFEEEMEDRKSSSSDESHDTDEGEGSEGGDYATGSGSWDSSSRSSSSHTSSEDSHMHPLFKPISSIGGWKLAKFDLVNSLQNSFNNSDDKGGEKGTMPSSERERIYGGPNYSSMGRTVASRESSRISSGGSSSSSKPTTTTQKYGYQQYPSGKRKKKKTHHQHHRLGGSGWPLRLDDALDALRIKIRNFFVVMELFISNMPSLVGSLALAWVSLGVDWFKWNEDNTCHPTHYHNDACVFPEFPGCFVCDTDNDGYQFALHFHYMCSTISFILCSLLLGKILIAFPVVRDELANPTTAAPLGLLCMALEKVFGGNLGSIGMGVTFFASALHTVVACWFIFISVVYKTLPEPSWFPNTTGIGLAAVKVYLYWTGGGYFLSGFSLLTFIMFYFVSLFRIHTNEKISVTVCWAQLSGPAVVLYGFTIFSQPGSKEDELALSMPENKEHFIQSHHQYYMPVLHVLFALCMVSMASSLYLLKVRWQSFREKEFSPAHVSFCAPLVSHANALQTYRSSLNAFSSSASGKTSKARHLLLYRYWTLSLICGTLLVLVMTWKFFVNLPSWCQINVDDDEMPPEPEKTIVTQLLQKGTAGDTMRQDFVSAAVLQANESGALVRVLQDGRMKYVRSRRMQSMGFDPIMNVAELISERDRLLQHVTFAAHPARDRGGVSSFDGTLLDTSNESDRLHATSGRRRLNFLSFDASTMMRGEN